MTREEARAEINARIDTELKKAPKQSGGYDTYICPLCGNGSGENGTGIATIDGKYYKCFKCDFSGDYLHYLKESLGKNEAEVFAEYGLEIDGVESTSADSVDLDELFPPDAAENYIAIANRSLQYSREGQAYLQSRGISLETANRCCLGYSPKWRSPAALNKGKKPPESQRIIIPTGNDTYLARAIDDSINPDFKMMKEGSAGIFNSRVLRGDKPVYVTEGAFDALSVIEVGGEAIALGSTSGVGKFLGLCKTQTPKHPLILSLDNDKAGQTAQDKLKKGLDALKIPYTELNIAGKHKDANEHLVANRQVFSSIINSTPEKAAEIVADIMQQAAEQEKAAYLATSVANHIDAFRLEISTAALTPPISTGFQNLDDALNGGIYDGLIIVGAVASLGKTTLLLQAADSIAMSGNDVLIFSLEMARYELMAKSISRLSFEYGGKDLAKSTRDILSCWKYDDYSTEANNLLERCIEDYRKYSGNLYIHEGIGTIGAAQIKQIIQEHIRCTGKKPVVIIDYLQILAPANKFATDKQNTDEAVSELKRLSRDKKIPVIAVSSFNRENYTSPVNLSSFKESGAIEYSSDILLGLQLAGMDELSQGETKKAETIRKIDEMKKAYPRKAELKVLKNRNGSIGKSVLFDYYPAYNCFKGAVNHSELDKYKKPDNDFLQRKLKRESTGKNKAGAGKSGANE